MDGAPGSSPLARGLHRRGPRVCTRAGIIPARAGFTVASCWVGSNMWDHPRSRGVYIGVQLAGRIATGSSPLARGLPTGSPSSSTPEGIIPARAGFTAGRMDGDAASGDHPRSRGVYPSRALVCRSLEGSSPLARGLLGSKTAYKSCSRIIPARAGFTGVTVAVVRFVWDHPRSRGVYALVCRSLEFSIGSSPLARGLLRSPDSSYPCPGIIPARAGFTCGSSIQRLTCGDHPRSRGVYAVPNGVIDWDKGSSPLARGLLPFA